ncbi:MAG TPA: glycoside hydrolase family 3 N-terminal domain-containing protein [Candidatus Pacearchaeota archaeon]|nr:glycoside hydrolase family 3 N-terminal domain-containing protein [Candidatus Pacearchaeota archaeon]HOR52478.1 glycoside hydrolase family 3 N-terminal domain-containing protein [Candidatus Pacearchaeota archaeon]HOU79216.1 glycoside hydrolase family 3 N-terminal domain-containing protein [Candidatus Pacearchaeota archaeon]HQF82547.1 glycoside hydrolase family 3 N-terminal domain-containing protein [Candidatus Pacearchaeota archaeon]HQI58108.1 glycoside hydrolase family 3 N-terminal domain-c
MNKKLLYIILSLAIILLIPFVFSSEENMQKTINISELSLDEKIGQLMFVKPSGKNINYLKELHVGGIFLNNLNSKENYIDSIYFYQNNSKIKLFVATDMEGYWNPFNNFYNSSSFGDINSREESYNLGKEHGKILNELGFNLDFSPIVETKNNVWPYRTFTGTPEEIKGKISGYIEGLHSENILTTAKHYPGGSLIKNPHLIKYKANISLEELSYFDFAISQGIDFIMVGHPIVYGAIDSKGKQSSISPEVIGELKNKFNGVIITDAVTMMGLRISYLFNFKKVYPDLILAGNDIILDTHKNSKYNSLVKRRNELKKAVLEGRVSQDRIDKSVEKILKIKGYQVVY